MKRISQIKVYLSIILFLGIALRLYKLGEHSLWADEANFVIFRMIFSPGHLLESGKFFWEVICNEGFGMGNYGYQIFSSIWSCLVKSEFMLRLPSLIFGSAAIYFIYKVGKLLFDKKAGLIAAFIIAVCPFHVYYSQEFRMYSLMVLLSLFSVYFLIRFQQSGRNSFLWGYVFSNALNFYVHITTALFILAQIVFFLSFQNKYRGLFRKWVMANLAVLFLIMPAAVYTIIELMRQGGVETIFSFTITPVYQSRHMLLLLPIYTLKNFCVGYTAPALVWAAALLLFFILFIWSIFNAENKESLFLCLFCLFIPILVMYAGRKFLYADRYLIPSSVFLYLIVANGIARLKARYLLAILTLILVFDALSLSNLYRNCLPCPYEQRYAVHEKRACREAVAYIKEHYQEGDVIFHTDTNITLPFDYYFNYYFKESSDTAVDRKKRGFGLILDFSGRGKDLAVFNAWSKAGRLLTKISFPVKGHKRVWLVFSAREFDDALVPGSRENRILEYISKYYTKKDQKYFKGIILYLFENPSV